jgi:hypothetical protein
MHVERIGPLNKQWWFHFSMKLIIVRFISHFMYLISKNQNPYQQTTYYNPLYECWSYVVSRLARESNTPPSRILHASLDNVVRLTRECCTSRSRIFHSYMKILFHFRGRAAKFNPVFGSYGLHFIREGPSSCYS